MPKEILFYEGFRRYSAERYVTQLGEIGNDNDFNCRINCGGGVVKDGFAVLSKLSEMSGGNTAIVDGEAASFAAFMLIFFKKRIGNDTSEIMLHKAAYPTWYEPTIDEQKSLVRMNDMLKGKMQDAGIDQALIDRIFQADVREDVYLTADEALKAGLLTEVRTLNVAEREQARTKFYAEAAAYSERRTPQMNTTDKPKSNNNTPIKKIMNIHELQAQHPALFAEAKEIGVAAERKRTKAFLGFVKSDDKTASGRAIKAIKDGEDLSDATGEITQLLMAGNRAADMSAENVGDLGVDPKPNTPAADAGGDAAAKAEALKAEEAEIDAILARRGGK